MDMVNERKEKKRHIVWLFIESVVLLIVLVCMIELILFTKETYAANSVIYAPNAKQTTEVVINAKEVEPIPDNLKATVEETVEPEIVKQNNPYASIQLNADDRKTLAYILAMEGQTEDWYGQCAIVEVVFNRVLIDVPYFRKADTVIKVLSQRGQFATWKYLSHPYNHPNETQYAVIDHVINNGPTGVPHILASKGLDYDCMRAMYFSRGKGPGIGHVKWGAHWFSFEP